MMNNSKLEELLNTARINELLHKKELEEKNKNGILVALAIVGAIATVAAIAYAVYRYFTPDYLDDFDDDYEDDFDDDYDYDDYDDDEDEKSSSRKKLFSGSKKSDDEDIEANTVNDRPKFASKGKVVPMKQTSRGLEVVVIRPESMEDASEITDTLLSGKAVVLNLEGIHVELSLIHI